MAFWKLTAKKLNGLAQGVYSDTASSLIAAGTGTLQNMLGGGRGGSARFYYDYNGGGSIIRVVARRAVGGIAREIKNETVEQYKKLIGGKKFNSGYYDGSEATQVQIEAQKGEESKNYHTLYDMIAMDDWGNVCYDALMLGIPEGPGYCINIDVIGGVSGGTEKYVSKHPVWYDTTALVTVSSDKDLILTRVTGRDYSRKELVSNGDMMFSVSGHITSRMPDIYPSNEVQKFRTMMEYKGILDVRNEIFDQWGVKKIVIRSFSLPPTEGNKSTQDYSFECVGIQPDTDAAVKDDTITIIDKTIIEATDKDGKTTWSDVLKEQLKDVLKDTSVEAVDQGAALTTGLLDSMMAKI